MLLDYYYYHAMYSLQCKDNLISRYVEDTTDSAFQVRGRAGQQCEAAHIKKTPKCASPPPALDSLSEFLVH